MEYLIPTNNIKSKYFNEAENITGHEGSNDR